MIPKSTSVFWPNQRWHNWHRTQKTKVKGIYKIWYPPGRPAYDVNPINACTTQIRDVLADARSQNLSLRVAGGTWSQAETLLASGARGQDEALLDLTNLNGARPLRSQETSPDYQGSSDQNNLWLVQCGRDIASLLATLEQQFGRSLRTSGAATGQTLVGAASTGTHGGFFGQRALHDQIVAIHLLAGPDRQFWIERASHPVAADAFIQSLGSQPIRNDELFNAVVVGFGAFGVIHNVVVETRPGFLLRPTNTPDYANGGRIYYDADMKRAILRRDPNQHPALRPLIGQRLVFFQPIIDPNTSPPDVLVTLMHEEDWPAGYQPVYPRPLDRSGPGYDFLTVMGEVLHLIKRGVPLFVSIAKNELFRLNAETGSLGEIFGYRALETKVFSAAVGVPQARSVDAIDALIALAQDREIGPVPLVLGGRYVEKSEALLAMNRFDPTFVISIDGVYNKDSTKFCQRMHSAMQTNNIPYTVHWGKSNYLMPSDVQSIFGSDLDAWLDARCTLLPVSADRTMFTNRYMIDRGLDRPCTSSKE